ncbi:MAG: hypothetical protein H6867_06715 [Rhodospirillales bacterium]|nr:hypothetical protein [Rhodospirillales bacterium]MCB9995241.1 hypothetical protein [Rhodospirillales bacterium]
MTPKKFIAVSAAALVGWILAIAAIQSKYEEMNDEMFGEFDSELSATEKQIDSLGNTIQDTRKQQIDRMNEAKSLFTQILCAHAKDAAIEKGKLKKDWRLSDLQGAELFIDDMPDGSLNCTPYLQQKTIPAGECMYQFEQAVNEGRVASLKLSALRESGDPLDVPLTEQQNTLLATHPHVDNATLHCANYITTEALTAHAAEKCYQVLGQDDKESQIPLTANELHGYGDGHPFINNGKLDCSLFKNSL